MVQFVSNFDTINHTFINLMEWLEWFFFHNLMLHIFKPSRDHNLWINFTIIGHKISDLEPLIHKEKKYISAKLKN